MQPAKAPEPVTRQWRTEQHYKGTVQWFDDKLGYGFISVPGYEDIFVHYTAIQADPKKPRARRYLIPGQVVTFYAGESKRTGRPNAITVVLISEPGEVLGGPEQSGAGSR